MASLNKVQSVHSIEITVEPGVAGTKDTPGRRPKTRTIPPGTLFYLPEGEDADALREAGAIKEPDGKHKLDITDASSETNTALPSTAKVPRAALPGAGSNPAPAGQGGGDDEGDEGEENETAKAQRIAAEGGSAQPRQSAQTGASGKTPPAKKPSA